VHSRQAADKFRRRDSRDQSLTNREVEILTLLASGHRNPEIARRLNISARTVEQHITNMQEKLGVVTRTELVALAYVMGILRAGVWPPAWSGIRFAQVVDSAAEDPASVDVNYLTRDE